MAFFWVSDERRDFELGDIGLRAVWRAEPKGGAWALSFCGEKGGEGVGSGGM